MLQEIADWGGGEGGVTWTQRVRFYKNLIEFASYYAH